MNTKFIVKIKSIEKDSKKKPPENYFLTTEPYGNSPEYTDRIYFKWFKPKDGKGIISWKIVKKKKQQK